MFENTKITSVSSPSTSTSTTAQSINGTAEFNYDPDMNVTFDMWFQGSEDLFKYHPATQNDAWKI